MAQPRQKQHERRAETRRKLIDGAIECLMDMGYAGANVQEICRRAGVTTGAIQHNFGSKQGLMTAVVEELFRSFADAAPPRGPARLPLEDRIGRLVDHYWSIYGDDRYFAILEILLATRHDEELMLFVARHRQNLLTSLRSFLPREFSDVDLPAETLLEIAHDMMDYLRGYAVHRLYQRETRLDDAALERARTMVREGFEAALKSEERERP
ncbi:TetR/AcrR family transcriptional regulator [Microbaculum marinum]|uniref:TetR/AcrR family transcriptional regulator n=1 Tax=Microbaculum marinum TaxID=1764581 RepID=A0AAW9RZ35_9HYPH